MATIRVLSGTSDSRLLSRGWKDYMLCCFFKRRSSSSTDLKSSRTTTGYGSEDFEDQAQPGTEEEQHQQQQQLLFKGRLHLNPDRDAVSLRSSRTVNFEKSSSLKQRLSTRSTESKASRKSTKSSSFPNRIPADDGDEQSLESSMLDVSQAGGGISQIDECGDSALDSSIQSHLVRDSEDDELETKSESEEKLCRTNVHRLHLGLQSTEKLNSSANSSDEKSVMRPGGNEKEGGGGGKIGFDMAAAAEDGAGLSDVPSSFPRTQYKATLAAADQDTCTDSHLFDVSDLQHDTSSNFLSQCGSLRLTLCYDVKHERMKVTVHEAQEIPSQDRGGARQTQIRLLLLPLKKVRQKTKVKAGGNPVFDESFEFKVPTEDLILKKMGIRIRLYGCERLKREWMIGETMLGFTAISLTNLSQTTWVTLEPRSNLNHADSTSDVSNLTRSDDGSFTQHGGASELLLGLSYNAATGRLSVEVVKGTNFKSTAMNRSPDTFIKMTLMAPNGQEITHSKTSTRRGQPNPIFKETFVFQVAQFQLPDVSLMVSVFVRRNLKRKEMIGWFTLGSSSSSQEDQSHWIAMIDSKGEQVSRWHVLLEP